MGSIPAIYWKLHKQLRVDGLDDETLASRFRLNKRDIPSIRTDLEHWFGKEPLKKPVKKVGK